MKVIIFTNYYHEYLHYFYQRHPELVHQNYRAQHDAIINDHFVSWGGFVNYFREMGVDAQMIIPNNKNAQKQWAKENSIAFDEKNFEYAIPFEQIKKEKPDVLYMGSMFDHFGDFLRSVKPYVKRIYGWIACHIPEGSDLSNLQLILSSLPSHIDNFRKNGIPSEYLHASFDEHILPKLGNITPDIDFSFVGSLTPQHRERIQMIRKLSTNTPLDIFGRNAKRSLDERTRLQRWLGKPIKLDKEHRLHKEVFALDMYRVLKRSKITFNRHIDLSENYIGNARMFEATGVGTLLLSDGKNAPQKLFNDDEVVYYDTVDEAIEKVHYYLANEDERKAIAERGQRRTLKDYSCREATKKLYQYFQTYMN